MKSLRVTFNDTVNNGVREFIGNVRSVETSENGEILTIQLESGSSVSYPWMAIRAVKMW